MLIEQLDNEYKYSLKHLKEYILNHEIDITSDEFITAHQAFINYAKGDYYDSKNKRIQWMKLNTDPTSVILTLFLNILLTNGELVTVPNLATQLGNMLGIPDPLDSVKTASEIIAVCCDSGWYDLYPYNHKHNTTGTLALKALFRVEKDTLSYIQELMYLPPMVTKPKHWTNNLDGGLYSIKESALLNNRHHSSPIGLDVLNHLQDIPLKLNSYIVNNFKDSTKKPLETKEAQENFENFVKQSDVLEQEYLNKVFHFVWKFDSRGRVYSQGYHINLQASSYKKACIDLAQEEYLNDEI